MVHSAPPADATPNTLGASPAHLAAEGTGAAMKALPEDFAEVVGVGEASRRGDDSHRLIGVEQPVGRLFQPDLEDELAGAEAGGGFEDVAEVATTHTVARG